MYLRERDGRYVAEVIGCRHPHLSTLGPPSTQWLSDHLMPAYINVLRGLNSGDAQGSRAAASASRQHILQVGSLEDGTAMWTKCSICKCVTVGR